MNDTPLHILLADDDESDRELFKEAFDELEMKPVVEMVNDGQQLMKHLSKEDVRLPNLIFLDLNMPRKNGMECLKEIRSNEKLKDISVAIYSTSASEKDINDAFISGANIYVRKPNDFNTLKQLLAKAVITTHLYQAPPFNTANFLLRL